MSEPTWTALGKKIDPRWGAERENSARIGIEHRAAGRRSVRRLAASVAAIALVVGGASAFMRLRTHASTLALAVPSASTAPRHELATFSVVRLSSETDLEALPDGGRGFSLRRGGARFTVQHDAEHPFVVLAGDLTIQDLGTTFTVQYLADDELEVSVEEGQVKVSTHGVDTEITAGNRRQFPLPKVSDKPTPAATAPGPSSSWRPLAESGRFEEAHTALKKAGPNAVRDETADLLLAADAARLGGYPSEAVPYLQRVVRGHSSDPRSSLASFTLGRVLLDELGRPREAADAFARARAAGGPLAEDALARQVEAASRAGDTTRSRELAREYQTLYPKGRRAKAVARFGGLD